MVRAEAAAQLDGAAREILAAPFYEESVSHEPVHAPAWMKAVTTLVIRNSQLEDLHAGGPVQAGGITGVTRYGLGPLPHFIAARQQVSGQGIHPDDSFDGLAVTYPRIRRYGCGARIW